jgi:hypothetical protein
MEHQARGNERWSVKKTTKTIGQLVHESLKVKQKKILKMMTKKEL